MPTPKHTHTVLRKPVTFIPTQSSKVNGGNLDAACLFLAWGLED